MHACMNEERTIGKMSEEELLQRVRRKAHEYNQNYSGCSQCVLLSLQDVFGSGGRESFMAATVLSGGIARRGETCGALIGALMALGLVHGREAIENIEQYDEAIEPALEICSRFKERLEAEFKFDKKLESTLCKEIQERLYGRSFDLTDEKQRQEFIDAGAHSDEGCPKVCEIAAQIVAEKILEIKRE